MFRRFGSEVTIVQRRGTLLAREDQEVSEKVAEILEEDGITLVLEAQAKGVRREANGGVELQVETADGLRTVTGSHLLVAVGRTPNSDSLNLPAAGVEVGRGGFIVVNERLETNVPGIFALGDVKGGPVFTHISYDDFRVVRTNLLEDGAAAITDRPVPYTVFIDPQLGRIGLSEREAREKGLDVKVYSMPMSYVARALELDEARGLLKAVVDGETDRILGFAALGIEGGELMAAIEIAMLGGVTASELREGIFAHPTLAESFNNLFAG